MARELGPRDYGVLSYVGAWMGLVTAAGSVGLAVVVPGAIVKRPGEADTTLGSALAIRSVGGVVTVCVGIGLFLIFRPLDGSGAPIVWWFGLAHLAMVSDLLRWWFEAREDWRTIVAARQVGLWVLVALRVGLLLRGAPLWVFAAVVAVEQVAIAAVLIAAFHRSTRESRFAWRVTRRAVRRLVRMGLPAMTAGLAIVIYMRTDQIMVGAWLGAAAAGQYAVGVRISEIWYVVPTALAQTALPSIVRQRSRDEGAFFHRIGRLARRAVWVSVGAALAAGFAAPIVVPIVFGAQYPAAARVVQVHIWTAPFVAVGWAVRTWIVAEERYDLQVIRTSVGAAANVVLNLVMIPRLGLVGAAGATVIAQMIAAWGSMWVLPSMWRVRSAIVGAVFVPRRGDKRV